MTEFGMKLSTVVLAFEKQSKAASKKAGRAANHAFNKELIRRDQERNQARIVQQRQANLQHRADVYGVPVEWLSM